MPTARYDDHASELIATLRGADDAGIDPAFDSDLGELESQFAPFRFAPINE